MNIIYIYIRYKTYSINDRMIIDLNKKLQFLFKILLKNL